MKTKLLKEITLTVQNQPSNYGITSVFISLGVKTADDYEMKRIDFEGQFNDKASEDKNVYALKSKEARYLTGNCFDSTRGYYYAQAIIEKFTKWMKKNEGLTSHVKCELDLFRAFLNDCFTVSEFTKWEKFTRATWPARNY